MELFGSIKKKNQMLQYITRAIEDKRNELEFIYVEFM